MHQNIFAHEILCREGNLNFKQAENNKPTTFKTILNLFEKFSIENVLEDHFGFLNSVLQKFNSVLYQAKGDAKNKIIVFKEQLNRQ